MKHNESENVIKNQKLRELNKIMYANLSTIKRLFITRRGGGEVTASSRKYLKYYDKDS